MKRKEEEAIEKEKEEIEERKIQRKLILVRLARDNLRIR